MACLHHFDGEKSAVNSPRLQSYDETVREGHTQYGFPVVGLILKNTRGKTMKKVLFATTAIVAFAGAAAADVAVSGSAELGIADMDHNGDDEVGFFSSVDVRFAMTGETDGGLAFGATIDLDDALEAGGNAAAQGGLADAGQGIGDNNDDDSIDYTIFVSGAFGSLTFGDTDGAMDWALTEGGNVGNPGSINDAETVYAGYVGGYLDGAGDGMIARYNYSFGDYAFAVSVEQGVADEENGYAIGFKGEVAGVSFGIAHQEGVAATAGGENADLTGVSVGYTMGSLSVGAMIASGELIGEDFATSATANDSDADVDLVQLGVGYTSGALTLHANYAQTEIDAAGVGSIEADGFGIAASYDLGGGASVHFGYGDGTATLTELANTSASITGGVETADDGRWSLGMAMSF